MIKRKKEIISVALLSLILATGGIINVDAKVLDNQQTIIQEAVKQIHALKLKEIIGTDRYDTAIKISKEGFKELNSSVILVNATSLSDALCVAPLANAYNCSILLINKDNIPDNVYEEINRLGAQDITLIGGEGVISNKVEEELQEAGYFTDRIYGGTRYETSLKIAEKLNSVNQVTEIAIVNGERGLADATSVAAPSARDGRAILYTNGKDISGIESFISKDIKKVYIVGKEGAVSSNIENSLKAKGLEVKRLGGDNRNDTNAKVLNEFYSGKELNNIYIAKDGSRKESDLVDALAAGPLAALNESPILIANQYYTDNWDDINTLSDSQKEFVKNNRPKALTRIGGGDNEIPFYELRELLGGKIEWLIETIEYSDGSVIEFEEHFIEKGENKEDYYVNVIKKDKNENIIWEFQRAAGYETHIDYIYDLKDGDFILAYGNHGDDANPRVEKYNKDGKMLWETKITVGDPLDVIEVNSIESKGDNIFVKSNTFYNWYIETTINKDGKIINQDVWDDDGNKLNL